MIRNKYDTLIYDIILSKITFNVRAGLTKMTPVALASSFFARLRHLVEVAGSSDATFSQSFHGS